MPHPEERNDVRILELLSSDWTQHVLLYQLLHTLHCNNIPTTHVNMYSGVINDKQQYITYEYCIAPNFHGSKLS